MTSAGIALVALILFLYNEAAVEKIGIELRLLCSRVASCDADPERRRAHGTDRRVSQGVPRPPAPQQPSPLQPRVSRP